MLTEFDMKKIFCIVLCAVLIVLCFSGCSGKAEMTEANVTKSVSQVEKALKDFDQDKLGKYVDSSTLSLILNYAGDYDFINEIGKSIFSNLSMEIVSIDLENATVTVRVVNKDLADGASEFAQRLKSENSTVELLAKLNNEVFVQANKNAINDIVENAEMREPVEVTLTIVQGKKNLAFTFDEAAEDAVSGGALTAIKEIYK